MIIRSLSDLTPAPPLLETNLKTNPSTAHLTAGPRTQLRSRIMIESDRELSAMVQELWDNDVNRLTPGKDYMISLQVHHTHTQKWQHFMCIWLNAHCIAAAHTFRLNAKVWELLFVLQGKAGDMANNDDNNDGAGSPLFTFVDENIFKKETFLGECTKSFGLILGKFSWWQGWQLDFLDREPATASYTTVPSHILIWHNLFSHTAVLFASLILPSLSPPFRGKLSHLLIISLWRAVAGCISTEHAEFTAQSAGRRYPTNTAFVSQLLLKHVILQRFYVRCCFHRFLLCII